MEWLIRDMSKHMRSWGYAGGEGDCCSSEPTCRGRGRDRRTKNLCMRTKNFCRPTKNIDRRTKKSLLATKGQDIGTPGRLVFILSSSNRAGGPFQLDYDLLSGLLRNLGGDNGPNGRVTSEVTLSNVDVNRACDSTQAARSTKSNRFHNFKTV